MQDDEPLGSERPTGLERHLRERVKELRALHEVGRLIGVEALPARDLLERLVALLPPAMQDPERTAARIRWGGHRAESPGFREGSHRLASAFWTSDGAFGEVEVVLPEGPGPDTRTPFLEEERHLVASLTEMLRARLDRDLLLDSLRAARTRYHDLVHSIEGVVWEAEVAPDGFRFLFVSEQAERLLGYPAEVWRAESGFWETHIHPEDREGAVRFCREATERKEDHALEYRMRAADGRDVWVRDVARYVEVEGGRPLLRGVMFDVTEARTVREEAERAASRLTTIFESITDAFFALDREWRFTFLNGEAERLLRRSRGELLGRVVWDAFPEAIGLAFESEYRRAVAENRTVSFEEHFPPLDVWFSVRAYPSPEGLAVYFRDVTARRRAEEALRRTEERFRELADNIGEIFYNYDPREDRLLYANAAYERIFGRPLSVAYDRPDSYLDFVHPEDRASAEAEFRRQLAGAETIGTFRIIRPDGAIRWIREHAVPVRDEAGEVERLVGTMRDITQEKEVEAQLLRTQRLESIGTLAGGIAHDLNNVLAPVLMALGALRETVSDPRGGALLDTLERSARRGSDLVRQVLAFARGVEGRRSPEDPIELVREVEGLVRETFPRDIELRVELPPSVPAVLGDRVQLHQVLVNLCVNARDAMPSGGHLSIALTEEGVDDTFQHAPGVHGTPRAGPHVRIDVVDTGSGIPDAFQDRIFDPFFSTKGLGEGTGLGLSTSLAIVKHHGGFLRVASAEGRGARFSVFLPAGDDPAPRPLVEPADRPIRRGRGETVLVVDDEESILRVAKRVLEQFGYEALLARDGEEGWTAVQEEGDRIAAVVTDLSMPGMDGPAMVEAITALRPELPVIASSGLAQGDLVERARRAGVKHFLPKPYTAEELLGLLRTVLESVAERSGPSV